MSDQTPPEGTPPVSSTPPPPPDPKAEANMWGMLAHLSALAGFIIPFCNIIGPLVVWLVKKDTIPFVNEEGKESLNFQITMTIGFIVASILMAVFIGFILLPALALTDIIFIIIASIAANKGEHYRYPFALRLVK